MPEKGLGSRNRQRKGRKTADHQRTREAAVKRRQHYRVDDTVVPGRYETPFTFKRVIVLVLFFALFLCWKKDCCFREHIFVLFRRGDGEGWSPPNKQFHSSDKNGGNFSADILCPRPVLELRPSTFRFIYVCGSSRIVFPTCSAPPSIVQQQE